MIIRYLILALTRSCNLRCSYCYHGEPLSGKDMPEAVLRQAVSLVASPEYSFHLQLTGGEPTLVPALIEKAAALARGTRRCRSMGIQTNGTCLTSETLTLFKTYDFQVGVSLDGPPRLHQQQRGMSAETLRGLQRLETAGIPFRVTTVVTQTNAAVLDRLVLTLAGFSCARGIGLDLLVSKGRAGPGTAVVPADLYTLENGLCRMLGVLKAVNARREIPIRLRELELLERTDKKTAAFCHACLAESMAVDPDGWIFPCGQTLGDSRFAAGTVWRPQLEHLTALNTCRPPNAPCNGCAFEANSPGDCPSRLYYNRHINPTLTCGRYRTLWESKTI